MLSADQPITFNTFHPFRTASNHDRGPESSAGGSDAGSGREEAKRKRLSAIELPTGETYLSIESPGLPTSITVEKDLGLVAREYRGGGTLPRHGLQQEWPNFLSISSFVKKPSAKPLWTSSSHMAAAGAADNAGARGARGARAGA